MADIVTRLRERATNLDEWTKEIALTIGDVGDPVDDIADAAHMREAADEIDRLRAEVQTAFDMGYRAAGGIITPIISLST